MKQKHCMLLFILFGLPISAFSEADIKTGKLIELARLTGINQQIQGSKNEILKNNDILADEMLENLKRNCPELSSEYQKMALDSYKRYLKKVSDSYTSDEVVQYWISLVRPYFEEEELDEVIRFYKTPTGKKFTSVTIEVTPAYTNFFTERNNDVTSESLKQLNEEINDILKKFNESQPSKAEKIFNYLFS